MFSALINEFKNKESYLAKSSHLGQWFPHLWECQGTTLDMEMHVWKCPEGPGRSSISPSILSLPGLILLIVSTGLDVSRQLYLHISK